MDLRIFTDASIRGELSLQKDKNLFFVECKKKSRLKTSSTFSYEGLFLFENFRRNTCQNENETNEAVKPI